MTTQRPYEILGDEMSSEMKYKQTGSVLIRLRGLGSRIFGVHWVERGVQIEV